MSKPLYSWGRYPDHPQQGHAVHWPNQVAPTVAAIAGDAGSTLPFGNGRSYGDSCLASSDQVITLGALHRFIDADWQRGIVTAEAGVTLDALLGLCIPRGWFPAVTPGTRFVTLGGAIANDVHGKNHHRRGTFGCHVRAFGLLRQGALLRVSRDEHPELFAATIGGLGLTGIITWVELQLMPVGARAIEVTQQRFSGLDDFFALSDAHDEQHEYAVAWVDCLAHGKQAGRGVYFWGDHATAGTLAHKPARTVSMPLTPPVSLVNRLSLRAFNQFYWHRHSTQRRQRTQDCLPFFYPLDGVLHWNRMYGPRGFQQYQCVIPQQDAAAVMRAVLGEIAASGQGSFLAVLKRCGDIKSPGLLSFPLPGTSLALDFPQHAGLEQRLFPRLDALVHEAGGRLYPAKDAHMRGEDFRRAYPQWEQLEALRDPALNSRFWQRVTR